MTTPTNLLEGDLSYEQATPYLAYFYAWMVVGLLACITAAVIARRKQRD